MDRDQRGSAAHRARSAGFGPERPCRTPAHLCASVCICGSNCLLPCLALLRCHACRRDPSGGLLCYPQRRPGPLQHCELVPPTVASHVGTRAGRALVAEGDDYDKHGGCDHLTLLVLRQSVLTARRIAGSTPSLRGAQRRSNPPPDEPSYADQPGDCCGARAAAMTVSTHGESARKPLPGAR